MAFHIPFNQRASAQVRPEPIYIGFEVIHPQIVPQRVYRQFNWWGFNGMWMAFASLLTAGILSPIPLLISLVGLRRPGKKMATVGTVVSLAGVAMATVLIVGSASAHHHHQSARRAAFHHRVEVKQIAETKQLLTIAGKEILDYRDSNDGYLPADIDGNMLVIKYIDPWDESLRFDYETNHGVVRSAGPDQQFDTDDDVTVAVKGNTDRQPLLPMDF